jgi:MFS family permease
MLLGFGLVTITTAGLGAIAKVKKPLAFKYLAIFLRFFQGQGDVMLQITGYSVITQIFSDDIMKYIGYIEIACGIGLGLGPSIGSILYGWLYYERTMYFFAGLNVAAFFICMKYIPTELNQTVSLEEVAELEMFEEEELTVDEKDDREENRKKISCCMLLMNKGAFFALMTMSVGVTNITFNLGYMPTQIVALGFDENNVGYVFGIQSFFYLITCLLLPYTCEEAPRKLMFLSAILGLTICTLMLGPSDLFQIN